METNFTSCLQVTWKTTSTSWKYFIDAAAGGQNTLSGDNPDVDFNGLNRLGADGTDPGLTFDDGFTSDYYYVVSAGNDPVEVYVNTAETMGPGGQGAFLGGGVGTSHMLSNGGHVALNNSNTAGVTDMTVTGADMVATGVELSIPLSAIGNPAGEVKITAFINSSNRDAVSNQVLCGLGGDSTNLGEPRQVDFSSIAGDQFFAFCAGVDGGMVLTEDGGALVYTCPGDSMSDIVRFDSVTTSTANYTYVITDANGMILALPEGDSADLEGAGVGECLIWGLAYTGNITAMVGDDAAAVALSDSCFDLSSNYITVIRDTAEAGVVTTAAGEDTVLACLNLGGGIIDFMVDGNSSAPFAYVITDTATKILGINTTGTIDFTGAGAGECWVWGLSYTGNVLVGVDDTVATAGPLTDGCFDLSDKFVAVFRDTSNISGGMVMTEDGEDTVRYCVSGMGPDVSVFAFDSTGAEGDNFAYVITDPDTKILGVNTTGVQDFGPAGPGECWVWGLSYNGNLTAMVGDTAANTVLADGCYELSENYVVVFRDSVNAGVVTTALGADTVLACANAGSGMIDFAVTGNSDAPFAYVITDSATKILGINTTGTIDFTGAGPGECWVWGLSFTGNVLVDLDDTVATAGALTDGCYDLSAAYVVVIRDTTTVSGGMVMTENGEDTVRFCVSGVGSDSSVFAFDSVGTVGDSFVYVITDPDTKILGVNTTGVQDFAPAGSRRMLGMGPFF